MSNLKGFSDCSKSFLEERKDLEMNLNEKNSEMESFTRNMWNEMTEKHGKQPTSQHLGIILILLCIVGGGLVGYFKSLRFVSIFSFMKIIHDLVQLK